MTQKKTAKPRGPVDRPMLAPDPYGLREGKSLQDLIAEQGVLPCRSVEDLAAPPGSLWRSDAELDQFLADLRRRRQQGG
jgi:hypothetical protein